MLTSRTLQQILDVLFLIKEYTSSGTDLVKAYHKSVNQVSKKLGLTYQAVGDTCRRRLDLESIEEFRRLVKNWLNGNPKELVKTLKNHVNESSHYIIQDFFDNPADWNYEDDKFYLLNDETDKKTLKIKISEQELRYLKALSEIEKIEINDFLRRFVREGIKTRMKSITQNLF